MPEPGLAFYYPLDPVSATLLIDLAPSASHLNIAGHGYYLVPLSSTPPPLCEGAYYYDGIKCRGKYSLSDYLDNFKLISSTPVLAANPFQVSLAQSASDEYTFLFYFYLSSERISGPTNTATFYSGTGVFAASYLLASE